MGYPFNMRLGVAQRWFGPFQEQKSILYLPGNDFRLVCRRAGSLVSIPTELSKLLKYNRNLYIRLTFIFWRSQKQWCDRSPHTQRSKLP